MRLWVGDEREGREKTRTLFLQSAELSDVKPVVNKARSLGVKRLYLGAGRTDVTAIRPEAVEDLKNSELDVIIEASPAGLGMALALKDFAKVIVRTEVPDVDLAGAADLVLKIDDMKNVCAVSDGLLSADISGLVNGLYETDEEVQI